MSPVTPPGLVMSWMLDRRLSFLFREFRRMKYFCAWLATCAELAPLTFHNPAKFPCPVHQAASNTHANSR